MLRRAEALRGRAQPVGSLVPERWRPVGAAGGTWGWFFQLLLVAAAKVLVIGVVEVPSIEAERVHGNSRLWRFHDGLRVLRTILGEAGPWHRRLRVTTGPDDPTSGSAAIRSSTVGDRFPRSAA